MVRSSPWPYTCDKGDKVYAAIWAEQGLTELPPPHEASATAMLGDVLVCSSILPWSAGGWWRKHWPDTGSDFAEVVAKTIARLRPHLERHRSSVIWGGDFNNTLAGRLLSSIGRAEIQRLLDDFDLDVPTADQPHQNGGGLLSIDHIAIPASWTVTSPCERMSVEGRNLQGRNLSKGHDAYVVEVEPVTAAQRATGARPTQA